MSKTTMKSYLGLVVLLYNNFQSVLCIKMLDYYEIG